MKMNFWLAASIAFMGISYSQAQESKLVSEVKAWGGTTVTYTEGQVVYISDLEEKTSITKKEVKLPYDIAVENGVEKSNINLTLYTYPNPTTDYVHLKIENYNGEELVYQLLDMQSDILESKSIKGSETQINIGSLKSEVYILNILSEEKVIKTFHVMKN